MNAIERFQIKGKVVLLTGGAGIYGRGLAADLASTGATLIIASRNLPSIEEVAKEERQAGNDVTAMQLDQASEESVLALRDQIRERFGRIDGLVNNSVARPMRRPDDPSSAWEESMRVNANGIYYMHRHFGEMMAVQNGGSIVNIGSIQGMVGPSLNIYGDSGLSVGAPDYFFHKGGMVNLTRYYAGLLGPQNVRVNCLSPGGFLFGQPEEFIRRYSDQTFLGRMGDKNDLGGSVIFLLSEAARYITGVNLPVDGGYTAR
jgi:NAD(P)-dependent dehydrogenase (short-subunit alcohol dehydrogenase family)